MGGKKGMEKTRLLEHFCFHLERSVKTKGSRPVRFCSLLKKEHKKTRIDAGF